MGILLKSISVICAIWVVLCLFAAISFCMDGKVSDGILLIIVFTIAPAYFGFKAFKKSKQYTEEGKRKLEEQKKKKEEDEIKLANERAEREKLEIEQKEKEFQEFKNKYPNHWQNILDKKLALDMTLEMVTLFLSEPSDRKESVMKTKTTEKYYFRPYKNAQNKTSYRLEVTFENGLVTGWKEL
jgi:Ca2+/Na+ antiporter